MSTPQLFEYEEKPERLNPILKQFYDIALEMDKELPDGEMKQNCFRRLLEAKDYAIKAKLYIRT